MAEASTSASGVPVGRSVKLEAGGQTVMVANVDGRFYAVTDICTHQGCSLADGGLEGPLVTCPCHGSCFDVTTGEVVRGPARVPLATYAVELNGDEIQVVLPEPEPLPAAAVAIESAFALIPLFAGLDGATIENMEAFAFRRAFAPGEVIVEEGRTGNGMYVVLSGRVEVIKGLGTPGERLLATLRPGEPFGELALLGDWKRTASVRAVDEVTCAGLDRWVFLAHLRREPELAIKMLQFMAQRLVDTDAQLVG